MGSGRAGEYMSKKQRILFLYLNTGSGHLTPARILASHLTERYGDSVECMLLNGFSPKQYFSRLLFERGYHFTNTFIHGAYSVFYDINTIPCVLRLTTLLTLVRTAPFLARYIREYGITKVVCLHFALGPAAKSALRTLGNTIPLILIVTDPFTAHPAWFLVKSAQYIVFSHMLQEQARLHGIRHAAVFPFILKKEFARSPELPPPAPQNEVQSGASPFRVLIAGGGEGLPGMVRLVRYIARRQAAGETTRIELTAVCGNNRVAYRRLTQIQKKYGSCSLHVLGYVQTMPELLRNADCIVSKAGASTVFEIASCCKPVIFCTYIHGQELGNVRFAVQNGIGWVIRKPADIYRKLCSLAQSPQLCRAASQAAAQLNVRSDLDGIGRFIVEL